MSEVKRFVVDVQGRGEECVLASDYAALEAECERTESRLHEVASLCATVEQERDALEAERDHLKACQENAELHITGLVAERNAALQQRDKLAKVLEDVEREHDLIRRMKNCEIHRGRGSFGIAVMSDTHAIEWQALDKELQQLIDARRAALSELTP